MIANISIKLDSISEKNQCFWAMGILNFIIVFYMAVIPSLTQMRASKSGAMSYLSTLNSVPISPWLRTFFAVTCYILIFYTVVLKSLYHNKPGKVFVNLTIYEIVLVIAQMLILDLSYNGIIFFVVAEFMMYMDNRENWFPFLVASFALYGLCNHYLVSTIIPFNSFDMWASYYDDTISRYILGLREIFEIINIMLFLLYIVLLIIYDKKEKKKIAELNTRLQFANFQLKTAVGELRDSNVRLKDANEQLHTYALEKEQMGETRERNRLAREIHDTLGHRLTGISVGIDAVQVLMDLNPVMAKEQLVTIGDMARNGLDDVRRSVRKLKPDSLETMTIDHAIYQLAEEMSKTTGSRIYFVSYASGIHYETDEEEAIFRLVQEGTTNAIRHGEASEVWIRLDCDGKNVMVSLKDNGKGCADYEEGFGLTHMRERVEMLGGTISFNGDQGFLIQAEIPIRLNRND